MKKFFFSLLALSLIPTPESHAQSFSLVNGGGCAIKYYWTITGKTDDGFGGHCNKSYSTTAGWDCLGAGGTRPWSFTGCPVETLSVNVFEYHPICDIGVCTCAGVVTSDPYSLSLYGGDVTIFFDCTGFLGASGLGAGSADPPPGPPSCGGGGIGGPSGAPPSGDSGSGAPPGSPAAPGPDGPPGPPPDGPAFAGDGSPSPDNSAVGMPIWQVSEPYLNVWLQDEPLGYKPGIGPRVALKLAYQNHESHAGYHTNVFSMGKGWNFPWFSFIVTNYANTSLSPAMEVHFAGGGAVAFHGTNSGSIVYTADYTTGRKLSGDTTNGFTVTYADGSQDIYGLLVTNGSGVFLKALMTERRNSAGNGVRLDYFSYTAGNDPVIRLKDIVDADGRTNTVTYVSSSSYSTNLISQITDPFGRSASMYYDSSGFLTKLVDAANLTNTFAYDDNGPTTMVTPYGTTTFQITPSSGNRYDMTGRSVRIIEPDGSCQLYVYTNGAPGIASSYSSGEVPITYPFANNFDNASLDQRNTFYWNRQQYAALSTTNIGSLSSSDFVKARMRHWLLAGSLGTTAIIGGTVSLERAPSQDGSTAGQKVWFDYTGKTNTAYQGTQSAPLFVAFVLPDGGTNFTRTLRNSFGTATNTVSTYSVGSTTYLRTNVFTFDSNEIDLLTVTNALGVLVSSNSFNAYHQPLTSYNALGETTIRTYDSNHRLSSITRTSGLITTNIYVGSGIDSNRVQSAFELEAGPTYYRTNSYVYSNALVYSYTDPRGLTVTNYWDNLRRLVGTACSEGTTSNKYYRLDGTTFANGNGTNILDVTASKDRTGFWTYFAYDALRRLIFTTNAIGTISAYGYCSCGSLQSITNAFGTSVQQATQNTFDYQGNMTQSVLADGFTRNYTYNALAQITKVSDAVGSTTNYYNNQGLLITSSNAIGQVSATIYDALDRATNSTDANGVTLVNTYDSLNRLITRTYPDSGLEKFGYTARGLTAYTNQVGYTNRYVYDALSRKTFETNQNGEIIQYQYSPGSDLKILIDGKSQTTTWTYDAYGRVTNKADNLGTNLFTYIYDPNYRLTNRTSAAKGTTTYKYDPIGNLTNIVYPVSSSITLTYDPLSRLTNMVDGVGTTVYSYDSANLLLTEDGPWSSDTVTYTYANRLRSGLSLSAPSASAWTQSYGYDAARRLTSVSSPAGSFSYAYDAQRSLLPAKLSMPPGSYITNTYDGNARLLSTVLKNSGNTALNSHSYGYNTGNQRTQQVFTAGNYVNYGYDNSGQLVTAKGLESGGTTNRWNEQFGYFYDAAGNLNRRTNNALVQTFNVNSLNELTTGTRSGTLTVAGTTAGLATNVTVNTSNAFLYADATFASTNQSLVDGNNTFTAIAKDTYGRSDTNSSIYYLPATNSFAYDLNGNLLTNGTRFFEYDDENQLIRITEPTAWKSEFDYDGKMRRRVRREYTWAGGAWSKTNEVHYVYDGNVVIQERDANNNPSVSFTRGRDLGAGFQRAGGIGGLLARTDNSLLLASGSTLAHAYYEADGNGNITAMLNSSQSIVAKYIYDAFGGLLSEVGTLAGANLYRFSSKEWHLMSGTYQFGYRMYSPSLQRWLSRDPQAERGGINMFLALRNCPSSCIDPWGLDAGDEGGSSDPELSICFINAKLRFMKHMNKSLAAAVLGSARDDVLIASTAILGVILANGGFIIIPLDVLEVILGGATIWALSNTVAELAEEKEEALYDYARDLNRCKCHSHDPDAYQKAKDEWDRSVRPFRRR